MRIILDFIGMVAMYGILLLIYIGFEGNRTYNKNNNIIEERE